MSELRISYNVIGNGFRLGTESFWIDSGEFEDDMDEVDIIEVISEKIRDHFAQHYYPTVPSITPVVEQIKQHLQGENNELA